MTCGHPVRTAWAFEVTAMPIIAAVEPAAHLRAAAVERLRSTADTVAAGSVAPANEANLVYVSFTSVSRGPVRAIARRDVPDWSVLGLRYSVTYSIT
jgi:hypothetical protein